VHQVGSIYKVMPCSLVPMFERNLQGKQFILKTEAKPSVKTLAISHGVILVDSYRWENSTAHNEAVFCFKVLLWHL